MLRGFEWRIPYRREEQQMLHVACERSGPGALTEALAADDDDLSAGMVVDATDELSRT